MTYTYDVTNTSAASTDPLSSVVLSDTDGTPTYVSGDTNHDGMIDDGETWVYSLTETVPSQEQGTTHTNTVTATAKDDEGDTASDQASATISYTHATFQVTQFTQNASGFDVTFDRAAQLAGLNIYTDPNNPAALTPDVTVVGTNTGPVEGSLVWNAATNTATFVKTGGPLAADTYTVTLVSGSNAFRDARSGELLDGNGDGTVGDNYTTTFTVASYSGDRIVSLPDFARGPEQSVDFSQTVIGDNGLDVGLPIRISDGTNVTSASVTVDYNPELLNITGVSMAKEAPAGWNVNWNVNNISATSAELTITATGTALSAGLQNLFELAANVPSTATYGAGEELRISSVSLGSAGGPIAAIGDEAMQKLALVGDATGDRSYSSMDASDIARVVVGLDNGFAAYLLTDPVVVGDVTADGTLSGLDAFDVARTAAALSTPIVPAVPGDYVSTPPNPTVDPTVTIPLGALANPGGTVTLPITVSEVNGLRGVDLAFTYNSTVLSLSNSDISLEGNLASNGWTLVPNVTTPGLIRLSTYGTNPIAASGSDTLLDVTFHVSATAVNGTYPVSVDTTPIPPESNSPSRLNEGDEVLSPSNGSVLIATPTVANEYVFYNNSPKFDPKSAGNSAVASANDFNAIANDKSPLLPGGTATFANYTSYSRGINGILVDFNNLEAGTQLSASDFQFAVGNSNTPSSWTAAPAPLSVTMIADPLHPGETAADIIWADNAIQKQWLQVTVKADSNTDLTSPVVFYYGNAIGETGNSTTDANVDANDVAGVQAHPATSRNNPAGITNVYDFNRDGAVDAADVGIAQANATTSRTGRSN